MITKIKTKEEIIIPPVYLNGNLLAEGIAIPEGTVGEISTEIDYRDTKVEVVFYVDGIKALVHLSPEQIKEKITTDEVREMDK